ncbi:hypothetical protein OXX69_013510, partial [Metschnikowia pulcherrima]
MVNTRSTSGASGNPASIINKKRKTNTGQPAVADSAVALSSITANEDDSDVMSEVSSSEDNDDGPLDPDQVRRENLFDNVLLLDFKKQSHWTDFNGDAETPLDAAMHAPLQQDAFSHTGHL